MKTQYKDHTLTLYSTTLAGDEHMVSVSFWYKVLSQSKDSWKGHYAIIWIRTICIFLKVAVPDKIGRRTTLQVLFTHSLEIKKKKKRKLSLEWNNLWRPCFALQMFKIQSMPTPLLQWAKNYSTSFAIDM